MISMIWHEIKHIINENKMIFILSVLAFTCACVAINVTLTNYSVTRTEQTAAEESYADKGIYKLVLDGGTEVYQRIFSENYIDNIKTAFEQLKSDPLFEYRYNAENLIDFFSISDSSYGENDFPPYKNEFLYGYETGESAVYDYYLTLKAFYVDNLFKDEPNVSLSVGEWFTDEDFYVNNSNNIILPAILGSGYAGLYEIGDKIYNAHLGTKDEVTLTVTGFLKEDSYFYDNNNDKKILNRYIIVPAVETTYHEHDDFTKAAYDGFKMTNTRIVFPKDDEEIVVARVYEILNQNKLYEFGLFNETGGWTERLAHNKNATITSLIISAFVVTLLFAIFCVQTYYKLLKNKKKYSILIMSGMTKAQLFLIIIIETLAVFLMSTVCFYILYKITYSNPHIDMGLSHYTFFVIPAIQVILLCFMGIFGCYKTNEINLSSTLREHE